LDASTNSITTAVRDPSLYTDAIYEFAAAGRIACNKIYELVLTGRTLIEILIILLIGLP